jgi:hypothetical protein
MNSTKYNTSVSLYFILKVEAREVLRFQVPIGDTIHGHFLIEH